MVKIRSILSNRLNSVRRLFLNPALGRGLFCQGCKDQKRLIRSTLQKGWGNLSAAAADRDEEPRSEANRL